MGGEINKKLALLLTLILVIGTMSMTAYAKTGQTEGEQTGASNGMQTKNAAQLTSLEVDGVEITNTTSSYWKLDLNGEPTEVGASADDYDFKMKDKELYLNLKGNAIKSTDSSYLREAIRAEGDLIINLESNGTVQGDYCGIYIENGSLTVKGGYVLDAVGNDSGIDIKNYTNNNMYLMVNNNAKIDTTATKDGGTGISVWDYADGSVSISAQGGSINANAQGYMYAIYASSQNGDVSVTASQGGSIMAECDGFTSCGIKANCSGDRNVSVAASEGGSITAKANGEGSRGIEIYSSYGSASVTANNSGSIKAEANGEESRGMLVGSYSGDISTEAINNGNITAEATGEGSTGLYHSTYFGESTISINSGILSAKGTEYCIGSANYESIEVKEGGIVFAEGDIPDCIVISEDSNGVVFENKVGKLYGDNVTLCANLKMPQDYTLTVDE